MILMHSDGRAVVKGDEVVSFRGEKTRVNNWEVPHKPSSEGFVTTELGRHYVSVYGLRWSKEIEIPQSIRVTS